MDGWMDGVFIGVHTCCAERPIAKRTWYSCDLAWYDTTLDVVSRRGGAGGGGVLPYRWGGRLVLRSGGGRLCPPLRLIVPKRLCNPSSSPTLLHKLYSRRLISAFYQYVQ